MPLVSVIVPTHKRPGFLTEALDSVRAQTFTDYEIIVVSNGEDADMRLRNLRTAAHHGARYFAREYGNVSAARNFGVSQARGERIAFLDDDDKWLPGTLATLFKGNADLVAGDVVTFGTENKIIRQRIPTGWTYHRALVQEKWYPFIGACLIRRRVFDSVLFDPKMVLVEDTDFWRRVSHAHSIEQIPTIVLKYRHGHQSASGSRARELACVRHYIKRHRDTPPHLRGDLPSPFTLARRVVMRNFTPSLLRQPRKTWEAMKRWSSR